MKPRYTIHIKQPSMPLRKLCGALYMQWAKDAAEDHARQQPWDSAVYYIHSNRTGRWEWVGRIQGKQVKWERPKEYYEI